MTETDERDRCWRLLQAAYQCSEFAWKRGDAKAHARARELFRKLTHRWKKAVAAEEKKSPNSYRSDHEKA